MVKLIVVIGITGTQGSSVARTFLKLPDWRVRGVTRNPSGPKAQSFAEQGADVVKADLDDKPSLVAAFAGANAIFAVTDFWAHFRDAKNVARAKELGKTINEFAYDLEVAQGVNIAEAAASLEVLETLERFVFSSLSEARRWSGGKYTNVYHFDSKAEIYNRIKTGLPELAARMSTVQIGHYVTNWKLFGVTKPQRQPDGSYLMLKPEAPGCEIPFVCTERDTGSFVEALITSLPAGTQLLGVSEFMTWPRWMQLWGSILGVRAGFKELPMDDFLRNVPDVLKKELSESYQYNAEFGWHGGDPEVLRIEDLPIHVPRTSMEEYIRSEDWSPVLQMSQP